MANTYSAGIVTAYGAAKRGGYTGTYEQFCADQANFARYAQQVREDKESVEQTVETFTETTVPAAVQSVTDEGTTQVGRVTNAGTTAVGNVNDAGTTQVGNVNSAGQTQVGNVNDAGTTQVGNVQNEGATQVQAVEDKGAEVIASIPSDYSDLTAEVDDLTRQLNYLENDILEIEYDNKYNTTTHSGSNTAITYDGDGVYTVGTTDWGHTAFGSATTLTPGMYLLYGVPCGRANLVLASDVSQEIAANASSQPIIVTIAETVTCTLRFSINRSAIPTEPQKITPYFSAISTKYDTQIKNIEENVNIISTDTDSIKDALSLSQAGFTWVNGYFINSSGNVIENSAYGYYAIQVKFGDVVRISKAYSTTASVAALVSTWKNNSLLSVVYNYPDVGYEDYVYTATSDCEVRICSQIGASGKTVEKPFIYIDKAENETYEYYDISMFDNLAVCGDSYTKAQFYDSALIGDNEIISWGKILGRMKGIDVDVFASSGADTHSWQERSDCLPALLSATAKRLYIFNLCINDSTYVTKGTIADIKEDYHDNPNTYYGNWGRIIEQVQGHAPNAKIILMKCWLPDTPYYNYGSTPIEEICEHYGIPYIDPAQHPFFTSAAFSPKQGGHPTPTQQSGMAKAVAELVAKCMQDNKAYFNDYFPQ